VKEGTTGVEGTAARCSRLEEGTAARLEERIGRAVGGKEWPHGWRKGMAARLEERNGRTVGKMKEGRDNCNGFRVKPMMKCQIYPCVCFNNKDNLVFSLKMQ